MTVSELNQLPVNQLKERLFACCGSSAWVNELASLFPIDSKETACKQAERSWFSLTESDWREAFIHHPKIGDIDSLRERFATTRAWASGEQSGVAVASQQVLEALAEGNRRYEEKFGYIFIVCATGKTAKEMLDNLNARLPNAPDTEIQIAMREQHKITQIRLEKLFAA